MPYKIDNLTNERLSISSLYLYPGFPAWVDVLTDPLVEAHNKQLVLIDPPPGTGSNTNVTITGSTAPIEITVNPSNPLPIVSSPISIDTEYTDIGGVAVMLLSANAARKSLLVQNLSVTRSVWIAYNSGECVPNQCILIPPRYYKEFLGGVPDNNIWAMSQVTASGPPEATARVTYEEGL